MSEHIAPTVIDPTGTRDMSDQLLRWCELEGGAGRPWRNLKLQPDGRYWCERGLLIPKLNFSTLDLNGAQVFAKGDGSSVRPFADNFQEWPRRRQIVRLKDSWFGKVYSSRPGACIDGGYTRADTSLGWEVGLVYDKLTEGQHGFTFDHCRDCTFDLRAPDGKSMNVEVRNVRGDLVSAINYSALCTAIGTGVDDAAAKARVWGEAPRGPGLHHSARQGLNVNSGCWGIKYVGLPVWQAGRSWLDMEPGGAGTVEDTLLDDCIIGSFRGNWISATGDGYVNDFVARHCIANRSRPLKVECRDSPSPWRGEPKRRSNWKIDDIVSEATTSPPIPLLRFFLVDGISVTNFRHLIRGVDLRSAIETTGCTDVVTEPNQFRYVG